mgnify:CR=1 FL=1
MEPAWPATRAQQQICWFNPHPYLNPNLIGYFHAVGLALPAAPAQQQTCPSNPNPNLKPNLCRESAPLPPTPPTPGNPKQKTQLVLTCSGTGLTGSTRAAANMLAPAPPTRSSPMPSTGTSCAPVSTARRTNPSRFDSSTLLVRAKRASAQPPGHRAMEVGCLPCRQDKHHVSTDFYKQYAY